MSKSKRIKRLENPSYQVADERKKSDSKPARTIVKKKKHPNRFQVFANKFGKTIVKINSKHPERVLPLIPQNVTVKVLEKDSDGILIRVSSKHLNQVIAILQNLCYDYKIIKIIGVVPSFFRLTARFGIAVGIALVVVVGALASSFVTRVSVSGIYDAGLKNRILCYLDERGVKIGEKIGGIDCSALSKDILAIDGVAFCSVERHGGFIKVFVKQELLPESFVEIDGSAVTAKKRAVVTRVIVDGGTAVVKYGDVVSPGDVLIDGYTEYGDQKIAVQASGEVWGKVYLKKRMYFANTLLVKTYGDTKRVTKLSFFGIKPKSPKPKFENYELEVRVSKNGFFLPYVAYTYEYREIRAEERANVLTDEEMKMRAYSQILSEIDVAAKILNTYLEIESSADGKYVTVVVEAEEKIS